MQWPQGPSPLARPVAPTVTHRVRTAVPERLAGHRAGRSVASVAAPGGWWTATGVVQPGAAILVRLPVVNVLTGQNVWITAEIDTGSEVSSITPAVAQALGLPQVGMSSLWGIGGGQPAAIYGDFGVATPSGAVFAQLPQIFEDSAGISPLLMGTDILDSPAVHFHIRDGQWVFRVRETGLPVIWHPLTLQGPGVTVQVTVPAGWTGWTDPAVLLQGAWTAWAPNQTSRIHVWFTKATPSQIWGLPPLHGPAYPGTCMWTAVSGPPQAATIQAYCPTATWAAVVTFQDVPLSLIDIMWKTVRVTALR
jgi:hypothetical protein